MKSKVVFVISNLVFFFALATARAETFEERVNTQHPNTSPYYGRPTFGGHRLIAIFPQERVIDSYRCTKVNPCIGDPPEHTDFDRIFRQRADQLCLFLGHGPALSYEIQWETAPEVVAFLNHGVLRSGPVAMQDGRISWAVFSSLQCSLPAPREDLPQ